MAGRCRPGDVLGLIEGDVAVIGSELAAVTVEVAERLLASGGDLVTIVTGADCPVDLGEELAGQLSAGHPGLEVEVHAGGQPHYPVLLGVE